MSISNKLPLEQRTSSQYSERILSLWRHLCHVRGIVDVKHCWHRIRVTSDSHRRSSDQSYYGPSAHNLPVAQQNNARDWPNPVLLARTNMPAD